MRPPPWPRSAAASRPGPGCGWADPSGGWRRASPSLALFAFLLTLVDSAAAGRAYAAYGGVYIIASLLWLWGVEGVRPDRWDMAGAAICSAGAAVILWDLASA